jgi:excisionase family DNA binding protein
MPQQWDLQPALLAAAEKINQETVGRPQACEQLGIHLNTLDIWLAKGKLPYVKVGMLVRIPRTAVEELIGGTR